MKIKFNFLFTLIPILSLIITILFFYNYVNYETKDKLQIIADNTSRELTAYSEQLAIFSELAPEFVRNNNFEEVQRKLNRLIFKTKGVLSVEMRVPSIGLEITNNISPFGSYLNELPKIPCDEKDAPILHTNLPKYGELSYQLCDSETIKLIRSLEKNDKIIGSVAITVSIVSLIHELQNKLPSPTLKLDPLKRLDFQCISNVKEHWCVINSNIELETFLLKSNLSVVFKIGLVVFFLVLLFVQIILVPLNRTRLALEGVASGNINQIEENKKIGFLFNYLEKSISNLLVLTEENISLREKFANEKGKIEIAKQVAHDIRSPLAALEMALPNTNGLPEDIRIIFRNSINRIRDIANSLLNHSSQKKKLFDESIKVNTSSEELTVTLLAPILESVISEKRMEFRNNLNITIEFNQDSNTYGVFVCINISDFKRVVSNLINNSIEALNNIKNGKVLIQFSLVENGNIKLVIVDNGKGIPSNILSTLGQEGKSFEKSNGNGLGLFHAKKIVGKLGGVLNVMSIEKVGTTIEIFLKSKESPSWFVSQLLFEPNQKIILFDDDQSIHQIWLKRIRSLLNFENSNIEIFQCGSANELRRLYGQKLFDSDNLIYLMDYEILGSSETGLDLILELGIQKDSILVTSHYEEETIRFICENHKIKLIPKSMTGFVPMKIQHGVIGESLC